jgi:hypothetical protein
MSGQTENSVGGESSRFAQTLTDVFDRVSYRRVDLEDLEDPVYRLRYEAYRREEFIPINSQRVAGDKYDHAPNAFCFGVYLDERLVSSIRMHYVTPELRMSPSRSIYPDILDGFLDAGMTYLDPSRFTADHEASLAFPALPFLTTRLVVMGSDYFKVDHCLSSVRPEHGAFYKRVFHSKMLAGERYYEGLSFPVCLYSAEVPKVLDGIYRRYPFYRSTRPEQHALFGTVAAEVANARVQASARQAQALNILSGSLEPA